MSKKKNKKSRKVMNKSVHVKKDQVVIDTKTEAVAEKTSFSEKLIVNGAIYACKKAVFAMFKFIPISLPLEPYFMIVKDKYFCEDYELSWRRVAFYTANFINSAVMLMVGLNIVTAISTLYMMIASAYLFYESQDRTMTKDEAISLLTKIKDTTKEYWYRAKFVLAE